MVPGFNHNVMHKGRMFHIQTEDSGKRNPHIITHLFIGGDIIESRKTSYKDIVGMPEMEEVVREMMEEQHKNMLRDLKAGKFDHMIREKLGEPEPETTPGGDTLIDESKSFGDVILDYFHSAVESGGED